MVHKEVGLKVLVDVLVDRGSCLVLSKVILALGNMVAHKEEAAIWTLLFIEFFNCGSGGLCLFVAHESLV